MRVQPQALYFNSEIRLNRFSLLGVDHNVLFLW